MGRVGGWRVRLAADVYQTKVEPRPHRGALDPGQAADGLRRQVNAGLLDGDVMNAPLESAGQSLPRSEPQAPAGLSQREVEVLRLIVRGLSNRQMADLLFISPKTVGHTFNTSTTGSASPPESERPSSRWSTASCGRHP